MWMEDFGGLMVVIAYEVDKWRLCESVLLGVYLYEGLQIKGLDEWKFSAEFEGKVECWSYELGGRL